MKFNSWQEAAPEIVRIIAHIFASGSDSAHEIVANAKTNQNFSILQKPVLPGWLRLYIKGTRHFERTLIPVFQELGDFPALIANFYLYGRNLFNRAGLVEKPLSVPIKSEDDMLCLYLNFYHSELHGKTLLTEEQITILKNRLNCQEFLFLIDILVPCWFLYGEHYSVLYRKARQGNVKSIVRLLRIDQNHLQNPKINKWLSYYAQSEDQRNHDLLSQALSQPPTGKATKRRIKYSMAGLISCFLDLIKQPITYTQMQNLFDVIAADSDSNVSRDEDLPESEDSFYKAVHREKQRWLHLFAINRTKLFKELSE